MPPHPSRHALVVDASQNLKDLLAETLPSDVWELHDVHTNQDALAAVQERAFDLIITSDKSSGREDVELLCQIRKVHAHTRFIILASEGTPSDVLDSMRLHAFSFFSTPYSIAQLKTMIEMAIEQPCWDDGIELKSSTPESMRLSVRCDPATAHRLLQFIKEISDLPELEQQQVGDACRELLLNAIEHGGGLNPNNYVEIEYVRTKKMISCRISDPGPGFTIEQIPHSAVASPPHDPFRHIRIRNERDMRPGGYGILMAQHSVDQVLYNEQGNEVTLIKYLADPSPNAPLL